MTASLPPASGSGACVATTTALQGSCGRHLGGGGRVGLREQGHAAVKVERILSALDPADASPVAFEMYRRFFNPGIAPGIAGVIADGIAGDAPAVIANGIAGVIASTAPATVVRSKQLPLSEEQLEASRKKLDKADFEFLAACPEPFRSAWLRDPEWWISLKDGYPRLNHQQEASKCMAYVQSKHTPAQMAYQNPKSRLRRWMGKAEWIRETRAERQAFRR